MAMSRDEAESLIPPEERERYCDWIRAAVRRYVQEYSPNLRLEHTPTARAAIINSHILAALARGFQEIAGASVMVRRGRQMVAVAGVGSHVASFKKLNSRRRPSYIRTRQSVHYAGQFPMFAEGDGKEPTHLFLGYQLNDLATDCEAIYMTCPAGERIAWEWKIWAADSGTVQMFPTIEREMPDAAPRRIKPRPSARAKEDESTG